MKFAIVCILFVLAALTYFRLHHQINIESDIVSAEKKEQMRNIKRMLQWLMVGLGVLVILCGYDLLYVPGADKYLGTKCGSCSASTCSGGAKIRSYEMPVEMPAYSGVMDLSLPDF